MDDTASAPFEGPEKLLEIWFAPSPAAVPDAQSSADGKTGLRTIDRQIWEDMLDIVKCKVLSVVQGADMDAYLLSESSLFVSPHQIASIHANMPTVHRCFYSRKSFMFPDRQVGPHRDWKYEVEFLDNIFTNGAAYTVGKVNGIIGCWMARANFPDCTIEILMSDYPHRPPGFLPFLSCRGSVRTCSIVIKIIRNCRHIPFQLTALDAYSFSPCGYSSNALIDWGQDPSLAESGHQPESGEGYYTIHVTPEEGWSYASFECNVPLPPFRAKHASSDLIPDLQTLVQRVVRIFQPGRLSLTLFVSSEDNEMDNGDESPVDAAQKAFRAALADAKGQMNGNVSNVYKRTDKINYEFGGYDLAFASFEKVK
ncbi:S-adenosylmethionine decarboxylase [Mucidula mucida]|nr:S-adenosylmethionine decarboxylase [Mucidula mucida]